MKECHKNCVEDNKKEYDLLWNYVTITMVFDDSTPERYWIDNADTMIHTVYSPLLEAYEQYAGEDDLEDFARIWIKENILPKL